MKSQRKVTNLNLKTPLEFYQFFAAIPADKWTKWFTKRPNGQRDAVGHLGAFADAIYPSRQCGRNVQRLGNILRSVNAVAYAKKCSNFAYIRAVNDSIEFPSARTNILNALSKAIVQSPKL